MDRTLGGGGGQATCLAGTKEVPRGAGRGAPAVNWRSGTRVVGKREGAILVRNEGGARGAWGWPAPGDPGPVAGVGPRPFASVAGHCPKAGRGVTRGRGPSRRGADETRLLEGRLALVRRGGGVAASGGGRRPLPRSSGGVQGQELIGPPATKSGRGASQCGCAGPDANARENRGASLPAG